MDKRTAYFLILCWILILHIIGIGWFTKGFLLKRLVIEEKSECTANISYVTLSDKSSSVPIDNVEMPEVEASNTNNSCITHKRYKRAIVIVIDALRFDFAHFEENLKPEENKPYKNKLTAINDLMQQYPQNAKLYKFMADPPTTTLQRLKGLTTGSLPTFVDASSNFGSLEITEDNIIDQLVSLDKSITFMGDDTWLGLYPNHFKKAFAYPSLNIMDLHTVDDGVLEHLLPEIKENDWDVLIAHFLGVDHCGHLYGPNHVAMEEKLLQMNAMLRSVIDNMEEDTILFVLGDHGMTQTGDHGGDSTDELESALFVYSPSKITVPTKKERWTKVWQVDLVPTLSLLLGAPIPFSNLGAVIPELFLLPSSDEVIDKDDSIEERIAQLERAVSALQNNAAQISRYLDAYTAVLDELPQVEYAELSLLLTNTNTHAIDLSSLRNVQGQEIELLRRLKTLRTSYRKYLRNARTMCQNVWARFDGSSMLLGGVTLASGVILLVFLWIVSDPSLEHIPRKLYTCVVGSAWQLLFSGYLNHVGLGLSGLVASLTLGFPAIVISTYIVHRIITSVQKASSDRDSDMMPQKHNKVIIDWNFVDLFSLGCMLVYGAFPFANSFLIYEDRAVLFIFMSIIVILLHRTLKEMYRKSNNSEGASGYVGKKGSFVSRFDVVRVLTSPGSLIILLVATMFAVLRLSAIFRACREEQHACELSPFLTPLSSMSENGYKDLRFFLSAGCLLSLVYGCRCWLRTHGNLNGESILVLLARFAMPLIAICVIFHWAFGTLPAKLLSTLPIWQITVFARLVYLIAALVILVVISAPLMVYLVPGSNPSKSLPTASEGHMQAMYKHVKANWRDYFLSGGQSDTTGDRRPPTVYGLGTAYTASLVTLLLFLATVLAMLLGDGMSIAITLQMAASLLLLETIATYIRVKGQGVKTEDAPWCCVILWCMLSSIFFFASGHQHTLTHIRWESAYVGFHGDHATYIIPATLVILNTFAAQVISVLGLPLILLWPLVNGRFAFKYSSKEFTKFSLGADVETRGEMALCDDAPRLQTSLFRLIIAAMTYYSFKLFCSVVATTIHRRHLMVWKIFAPHFVYEALTLLVTFPLLICVYLLMLSIDSKINRWLEQISKNS